MKRRTCPGCGRTYAWWRGSCWNHGMYRVSLREWPRLARIGRWLAGERKP